MIKLAILLCAISVGSLLPFGTQSVSNEQCTCNPQNNPLGLADGKNACQAAAISSASPDSTKDIFPEKNYRFVYDNEGYLRQRLAVQNDVLNGPAYFYDKQGRLEMLGSYANNLPHGPCLWWDSKGRLIWSGSYCDGTKVGNWLSFNDDGSIREQEEFPWPDRRR